MMHRLKKCFCYLDVLQNMHKTLQNSIKCHWTNEIKIFPIKLLQQKLQQGEFTIPGYNKTFSPKIQHLHNIAISVKFFLKFYSMFGRLLLKICRSFVKQKKKLELINEKIDKKKLWKTWKNTVLLQENLWKTYWINILNNFGSFVIFVR